jgi:hypothetical protein
MKKMIIAAAAFAAVSVIGAAAEAASAQKAPVYFKSPVQLMGTGCPSGSVRVSGEGTSSLTAAMSKYDAAQPSSAAASKMERASCNAVLPVRVPKGWQVSSVTVTWKGQAKGAAELYREYFTPGQRGPVKTSRPSGRFTKQDSLPRSLFSTCGKDIVLRINSSVRAAGPGSKIAVGGGSDRLTVRLKWRKCGS